MRNAAIAILAVAMLANMGCSHRIADLTIVSTKNVEVTQPYKRVAQGVEVSDSRNFLFIIPLGSNPNLEEAIDMALEEADGDYLTNAVIYVGGWWAIVWGQDWVTVKGDVWRRIPTSIESTSTTIHKTPSTGTSDTPQTGH